MARSLENLQKQYNSAASAGPMGGGPGPGRGPGRGPGSGRGPMAATNSFQGKPADTKGTIARIFSYVGKYWKRLILVFLCMLLSTGGSLAGGYLLRPIVNHIADAATPAAERVAYLAGMLGVLVGVYLIGIGGTYLQSRLMIGVSRTAIQNIRDDLFTKLERLPLKFHDNQTTGELMSRFTNDVDNIGLMLDQSLMSMFSGIINLIGTLTMMVITNIWLTLITLVFIPLFIFSSRFIIGKSRKYYAAQQAALGAANGYIEESVAGQKVIKVFNHEADCVEEFGLLNGDLRMKQMKAMFFGGIMGPIMGNMSQVSYALTAGIGGALCALGRFDVGGLAIFVNYSRQFARPINEISQQVATLFSALAGAERVFAVMDKDPEAPDPEDVQRPERLKGHVVLDDVSFGYVPDRTVLKHISLYARPGQKIAFVGSTGAGKTTITNLLNRFYDIDSGKITIDGIDIQKLPRDFLRQNIANTLRTAGRHRRGGRRRGEDGLGGQLHPPPVRRLQHRHRGRRREPLPGPAAASEHRPRRHLPRAHTGARRGHLLRRYPHRAPHRAGHGPAHAGPHHLRHRPPALHRPQCRRHHGAGERRDHRARQPRRPAGHEGPLLRALHRQIRADLTTPGCLKMHMDS